MKWPSWFKLTPQPQKPVRPPQETLLWPDAPGSESSSGPIITPSEFNARVCAHAEAYSDRGQLINRLQRRLGLARARNRALHAKVNELSRILGEVALHRVLEAGTPPTPPLNGPTLNVMGREIGKSDR